MKKNALISISLFILVSGIFWSDRTSNKKSNFRDAPKDDFGYIDLNEVKNNSNNVPVPQNAIVDNSVPQPTVQNIAIYGDNTIRDYFAVRKSLKQLSHSTVAFVKKSSLIFDDKKQKYIPVTGLIGEDYYLSYSEDFTKQLSLSFCSGSKVSNDLILTAGHCVENDPASEVFYKNIYVVFGWRQTQKGKYNLEFSKDDVYEIERILIHKWDKANIGNKDLYHDYALVILNKRANHIPDLTIDRSGDFVFKGNKVFTIGYPMGMSVKITDPNDAKIYDIGKTQFITDIDSFGGNSGGPVFDSYTKRIIGILVTGDARERKYKLETDISISYRIDESERFAIEESEDETGGTSKKLVVPSFFINYLKKLPSEKKIKVDDSAMKITFSRGGIYYNSDLLKLVAFIGGGIEVFERGELVRFPSFTDPGTGVQRIDSLIDAFVPLNSEEKAICDFISTQVQKSRPAIDPKWIMLYKMNKCNKAIEI